MSAEQASRPSNAASDARRFVRTRHGGVLATVSLKHAGYPFGSIVQFVLDHAGRPVFLASALAEHTRNLAADSRCSLLVQEESAGDPQALARATLIGDAARFAADPALVARFLRFHPNAQQLLDLGDFAFHRIELVAVRFIGGFGRIHWSGIEAFAPPVHSLAEAEAGIVEHMNVDHADALRTSAAKAGAPEAIDISMIGCDVDGIDLRIDGRPLRIDFPSPATNPGAVRKALIELARRSV